MSESLIELSRELASRGYEVVETHISMVFLGSDRVYKVKKPVALGFLDFSSISQRRAFCEAEVELNRRLAPDVYLGVVAVTRAADGSHAFVREGEGAGEVVDWAVEMRRLPDAERADLLLSSGELGGDEVERIAVTVARFHERARCDAETSSFGGPDRVKANVEENFEQTAETIGSYLTRRQIDEVEAWQHDFLARHRDRFVRRVEASRVRDGHGDLRLEHVYLGATGEPRIIDCIEFNDRFRYADVAADVAFLAMDLTARRRVDLAETFLACYCRESQDYDLYEMVDFYESYRAFVRGKISSMLVLDEGAPASLRERAASEARHYFLLSLASERRALVRPTLVAVGGWIATGKSTVAEAMARRLAAPVVSADRTRKQLLGVAPTESVSEPAFAGAYSEDASRRVYTEVLRRADVVVRSGRSVILDASFRTSALRRRVRALAEELGVPFRFVECVAPRSVCRERLVERARGSHVSDGRLEIFDDFVSRWEPVEEMSSEEHAVIDTSRPLDENLEELRSRIPSWPPR